VVGVLGKSYKLDPLFATTVHEDLLSTLAPRLKEVTKGDYARGYRTRKGRLYPTPLHQLMAEILDALGVDYEEKLNVGRQLRADFSFRGTLVLIEPDLTTENIAALKRSGKKTLILQRDAVRSDFSDPGIRIIEVDGGERLQTIFIDDPSFNFDYAHVLPKTEKCSVMHGHTSSVLVEIVGRLQDGMVIDFSQAKRIVREAVKDLDHKLFISEKYLTSRMGSKVGLAFKTIHGDFSLVVPRGTTVLLPDEATTENLSKEILDRIARRMPENVTAVGVYVYEGMNKGSHILAEIHRKRGTARNKR
jgi:6-pyruvoyltetrahydropterin/6-carboxytetrahydropterin synthase